MAEYKYSAHGTEVILVAESLYIPNDPANRHRMEYEAWVAAGGVTDPADPIPPTPPSPPEVALYDHEARISTLEGATPPTLDAFVAKLRKA